MISGVARVQKDRQSAASAITVTDEDAEAREPSDDHAPDEADESAAVAPSGDESGEDVEAGDPEDSGAGPDASVTDAESEKAEAAVDTVDPDEPAAQDDSDAAADHDEALPVSEAFDGHAIDERDDDGEQDDALDDGSSEVAPASANDLDESGLHEADLREAEPKREAQQPTSGTSGWRGLLARLRPPRAVQKADDDEQQHDPAGESVLLAALVEASTTAPERDTTVPDLADFSSDPEVEDARAALVHARRTTSERVYAPARPAPSADAPVVLYVDGLRKRYGDVVAVDGVSLNVRAGSIYGIVGPNGAGKTTTLSIVTGLLRADSGTVYVNGIDAIKRHHDAQRAIGVLPDHLRTFDRLTGAQLLRYAATLRGLDGETAHQRATDLARAFGIEDALGRLVSDYSEGMTKKICLAAAMIHAPRLLVLDEPFEGVDPVSAATVTGILERYVEAGGAVLFSSHSMDLVQRVCDSVAIIIGGEVLDAGPVDQVRGDVSLEEHFVALAGGRKAAEGLEWLHSFSD
jgi:ABC-2 type transport system ATP-binding protein